MENEPFQSEYPVVRVRLIRETTTCQIQLSSPEDAMKICEVFLVEEDREHLIVLMLSAKNDLIGVHTVSIGNLTASIVSPREVFKAAILANACSIILAHNHPSGDPEPSVEDIEVTRVIRLAGELLQIHLIDHIIVGRPGRSVSLKRRDLL
ncbi:MAG: DNA repair protein RadC [Chthonomonas sp.]|nr:DNA repair protein RadC [Chthonomonas sp.]